MKITTPTIEERPEKRYLGIRANVSPAAIKKTVGALLPELFAWMKTHDISPEGAPFLRFHVIDMEAGMDIEVGVPVAATSSGDARVTPGVLPAGRYAALIYSGVTPIRGNKALIEWAAKNGVRWDRWDDAKGDAFRARYETFLTDPDVEPDKKKWETEVAIKVAE